MSLMSDLGIGEETNDSQSDKSILMENVKPFELQCTKHVTLALLKYEIEAKRVFFF